MHWTRRSAVEEAAAGAGAGGGAAGAGRGADVGSGAGAFEVLEEGSWVVVDVAIVRAWDVWIGVAGGGGGRGRRWRW